MLPFYSIWTVARIEAKTLFRSWFFRILSGLVLALLILMGIFMYTSVGNGPWAFRGISSAIPYVNLLFLNVAQAVIAVFLASDFLKRDRKLDTTEVVYMRSMTNWDYVIGKTAGILFVFLLLNLAVLIVAATYNIFFADVPFMPVAYLTYPLIISLPTLVFILGLSFLLMVLIRNQAVTFIILLGYIGATLFYLGDKLHTLLDFTAWRLPLLYSDFTGYANVGQIFNHRGIYLLLGLSFIFLTILMIKRLPQSRLMTNVSRILAVSTLVAGVLMGTFYVGGIRAERELRRQIIDLNKKWIQAPDFSITACDLALSHGEERIDVEAELTVTNHSGDRITELVFSLNPGLEVSRVVSSGEQIDFERDLQILRIKPGQPLDNEDSVKVSLSYGGRIEEAACYPDVSGEVRERSFRMFLLNIPRKYAVVSSRCLLLTPESLWYPVAGARFDPPRWEAYRRDFTNYTLRVETKGGMIPVSQGERTEKGNGKFLFTPRVPLTGLSLVSADYQQRSVLVDSVEYNLYTKKGHDYFAPYFTEVGDTLQALIRELKQDYENDLELEYPYRRLSLVEVPVNILSYRRVWTLSNEFVQPEMVLLPEMGLFIRGADFRRFERWGQRRGRVRFSTERGRQAWMLENFVSRTITGGLRDESWGREGPFGEGISYDVFPNYYTFISYIDSDKWPVLNLALESYLASRMESGTSEFYRYIHGLTAREKANLALGEKSFRDIIADEDEEERELASNVLKIKGEYLFALIESRTGEEEFNRFLNNLLEENRFSGIEEVEFISGMEHLYGADPARVLDSWYRSTSLPGFLVTDVKAYKIVEGGHTRYQVRFKISNQDSVDGLVKVSYRSRGGRGRFGPGPPDRRGEGEQSDVEKLVPVGGAETIEIGAVLDYEPRELLVNTMLSRNLPSVIQKEFGETLELNENVSGFDGVRTLRERIAMGSKDELIVDNEDPGFKTVEKESSSLLKRLLGKRREEEDEYSGMRLWEDFPGWRISVNSQFYGECVRSAHFTRGGDGDEKVFWEVEIPQSGYYEVYCYITRIVPPWMRRRGGGDLHQGSYLYSVHHDDGVEEVEKELKSIDIGWNFLGSYYFSEGTARVELTNKSEARMVLADAVKWVKR
jgi:ABC-type transport system involved in multi-copper enzyme maturation permease subunit